MLCHLVGQYNIPVFACRDVCGRCKLSFEHSLKLPKVIPSWLAHKPIAKKFRTSEAEAKVDPLPGNMIPGTWASDYSLTHFCLLEMILETALVATIASVSLRLHKVVNDVVPDPYMDEIFHIPQAQAYCNGSFSTWDPKITTLPGLYLLSASVLKPLESILGASVGCTVRNLRLTNLLFNMLNIILLYKVFQTRFKILFFVQNASSLSCILSAIALGLCPVLYFFSYMYYTDPASTLLVLLMHYTFLKKRYKLSPIIGLGAIIMRQTNVVWLVWHVCCILWEIGESDFVRLLERPSAGGKKVNPKRDTKNAGKKKSKSKLLSQENYYRPIPLMNWDELIDLWPQLIKKVVPKIYMYGVAMGVFGGFITLNGGVVVGDKQAHQPCLNFPQVFYFTFFVLFMSFPTFIYQFKTGVELLWRNKWTYLIWIVIGVLTVHYNTIVHEYTLADNRHYTFYLWKRVYEQRWYLRYLLVPIYVAVAALITTQLESHPSLIFTYVVIVCANLVPQKLLEFRYFILPFFMYRLNSRPFPLPVLIAEIAWVVVINYVTVSKFLYQPFEWPHAPGTQRFMW